MKYLFLLILVVASLNTYSQGKRRIYVHAFTFATSHSDTMGVEATITISNPSSVNQKIDFGNLKMIIYANSSLNSPKSFYNTFTPEITGKWNVANSSGHNINPNFTYVTNPTTIATGEILEIKIYARPYSNMAPFFGDKDFGNQHWASVYGGGRFLGQILVSGFIEVTDVAAPGFVLGSGVIMKPENLGGNMSARAYEFLLNGGKPF